MIPIRTVFQNGNVTFRLPNSKTTVKAFMLYMQETMSNAYTHVIVKQKNMIRPAGEIMQLKQNPAKYKYYRDGLNCFIQSAAGIYKDGRYDIEILLKDNSLPTDVPVELYYDSSTYFNMETLILVNKAYYDHIMGLEPDKHIIPTLPTYSNMYVMDHPYNYHDEIKNVMNRIPVTYAKDSRYALNHISKDHALQVLKDANFALIEKDLIQELK